MSNAITKQNNPELFAILIDDVDIDTDHIPKHGKGFVTARTTYEGKTYECETEWDYSWGIDWDSSQAWYEVDPNAPKLCPTCDKPVEEEPKGFAAFLPLAVRTEAPIDLQRFQDPESLRQLHAAIGISTEAGELVDAFKKAFFYGKDLDRVNVLEEVGDLMWYVALLLDSMGEDFEKILQTVISKLQARYPEKFDATLAEKRDLITERKVLEEQSEGAPVAISAPRKPKTLVTPLMRRLILVSLQLGESQKSIAAALNIVPATVSRIKGQLKEAGLLDD